MDTTPSKALQETHDKFKQARTFLLLRFGTMEEASRQVYHNRSLTDDMTEEQKELMAYWMCNFREHFYGDPAAVLAAIKERKRAKAAGERV